MKNVTKKPLECLKLLEKPLELDLKLSKSTAIRSGFTGQTSGECSVGHAEFIDASEQVLRISHLCLVLIEGANNI